MKKIFAFIIFLFPLIAYSNGVSLGATRIIYNSNIKQTNLVVTNSDKENSFLIQSWVSDNQGNKNNDFIVTPPLYILDANKENALRIMYTGEPLPADRESLFWMNVKAIPSLDEKLANENTLQIAIQSRIKLFYRPSGLSAYTEKYANEVTFSYKNGELIAHNPTPYHITMVNLAAADSQLPSSIMINPFSQLTLGKVNQNANTISFQTINDYGAQTPVLRKEIVH
ncbi:TPA: fimbria/pilus periplasmic chaperone [Proteus mirabilis]|nr:fimbria/pilus periplasmic chaperone [Proteus mirabilis]HCD1075761.1 fimbria/pilus periplasmic chaperone [Proteus mirabilis]HCD1103262.1 fimbria/pilus periplasmic chaperone [Proteus mirabilis]HCD1124269.1 fimbria/pilus periplasmic chaperone [Proteus mirabilis]